MPNIYTKQYAPLEPCGTLTVEVKRSPDHGARKATLTLSFSTFDIKVPSHHIARSQLKPVKLQVILALEENPPSGINPISWLLITSLEINGLENAARCVKWYTYRWLIERYHYALKSGCGIEKLQLETAISYSDGTSHLHNCCVALIMANLRSTS